MALASSIFKGTAESIKKILEPGFADVTGFSYQYESPADVDLTSPEAVSIFLYSVVPNQFLRNTGETIISRDAGSASVRAQDLVMDLYFMITAYAQTKDSEFAILERVMQMLHDNPVIEGANLTPGLVDNENTKVRLEPVNISMDELNKLWSIFPNKSYRLSVFCLASPVKMLSTRIAAPATIGGYAT